MNSNWRGTRLTICLVSRQLNCASTHRSACSHGNQGTARIGVMSNEYARGVTIFGWTVAPVTFFGEIATLGTILVALVYLVSNIALPVYYRRHHPDQFSLVKHLILPILGVLAIGFPLWALVQPGQPAPFNLFPWIALGIIVIGLIYAVIISRRDPTLGDRVGSIDNDSQGNPREIGRAHV